MLFATQVAVIGCSTASLIAVSEFAFPSGMLEHLTKTAEWRVDRRHGNELRDVNYLLHTAHIMVSFVWPMYYRMGSVTFKAESAVSEYLSRAMYVII